jgi:hypothetical protein
MDLGENTTIDPGRDLWYHRHTFDGKAAPLFSHAVSRLPADPRAHAPLSAQSGKPSVALC